VAVWELRYASVNDHAMIVPMDDQDVMDRLFFTDGKPLHWMDRPLIGLSDGRRKKNPRPPADVSLMVPGALVLNGRARAALGPFLSKFGQFLELETEGSGEIRYFYNVTNVLQCVDVGRSEKLRSGGVRLEVFDERNVPTEPAVFKDPSTARVRIYVNDAGKAVIDELATSAGLTGIECGEPRAL
jgi:hypothetical protein